MSSLIQIVEKDVGEVRGNNIFFNSMSDKNDRGPYKLLKTESKYKNPWIEVIQEDVVFPNGKKGYWGIVDLHSGTTILPIDSDNNVYFTKGYRYANQVELLEGPSGSVEEQEDPLVAAKRELEEEIHLTSNELIFMGETMSYTNLIRNTEHLFLALNVENIDKEDPDGEELSVIKMNFDKALELVRSGNVMDANTALLIYKAKDYLGL